MKIGSSLIFQVIMLTTFVDERTDRWRIFPIPQLQFDGGQKGHGKQRHLTTAGIYKQTGYIFQKDD